MPLKRLLTPLLSLWLLAAFVFTPVARAQATVAQPLPSESAALRLSDESAEVPQATQLVATQPVYQEAPGVPGGVGMPGQRVGSDVLLVGLAAFAGAFLGGFTAGSICCFAFFVYYY